MGDYAHALARGSELGAAERAAIAEKLHQYTGLPVDYILRADLRDRKSTRLNSSHGYISYAVFCLKKKKERRTSLAAAFAEHADSQQYGDHASTARLDGPG